MGDLQSQQDSPLRPYGHDVARLPKLEDGSLLFDRLAIWAPAALGFVGLLVLVFSPMCAAGIVRMLGLVVLALGLLFSPFALRGFRRTRPRRRADDTAGICTSGGIVALAFALAVYLLFGVIY